MKILYILIGLLCVLQATPHWYEKQEYISSNSSYYGYGEGSTKEEALQNAYQEVVQQIKVTVTSKIYSYSDDTKTETNSHITTFASESLKEVKIKNSIYEDDRYYVLVEYMYTTPLWFENRSVNAALFSTVGYGSGTTQGSALDMAKKDLQVQTNDLKNMKITPIKSEKLATKYFVAVSSMNTPNLKCTRPQNKLIGQSSLVKNANRVTSCDYPYVLEYMNKNWYIKYANTQHILSPKSFDTFFNTIKNKNIILSSAQREYQEGEGFHLNFNIKKDGYLTLFNIYEDGRVGLIMENEFRKKKSMFSFPSLKSNQEFYAALNSENRDAKDMYVAILSEKKLNLSQFKLQKIENVNQDEYKFNQVIELCQKHTFTTLVLRTLVK